MSRKVMDCRETPSEINCSLKISGEETEVIRAATEHAIQVHGEKDGPELQEFIRSHLKDEEAELPQARSAFDSKAGGPFVAGQEDKRIFDERSRKTG
jgi:predicted small metal-binding protein